jgi:hypothetical protein
MRSRDPAGNEHQVSDEVSAVPDVPPLPTEAPPPATETPDDESPYWVYLPLVLRPVASGE